MQTHTLYLSSVACDRRRISGCHFSRSRRREGHPEIRPRRVLVQYVDLELVLLRGENETMNLSNAYK